MNLDDLELELRKLPGIRWAAFSDLGDRVFVQLHAMQDGRGDLALEASRIAARHCDVPIAVDLVRWMTPPVIDRAELEHPILRSNGPSSIGATPEMERPPAPLPWIPAPPHPPPEILGVLTLADSDEVEVQLGDGTTRTIGRAAMNRGLIAAVDATLEAVRAGFTVELPVQAEWARTIETTPEGRSLVTVALARPGRDVCYGLSSADTPIEAAARATLDALHRNLRMARRADPLVTPPKVRTP